MSTFTPEKASADIGVYGLGVMGANLARNLARNGYATAVFNRTPARTEKLMAEHGDEATFVPASTLEDFVASLRAPRVAIMMVQAGPSTDAVMGQLADLMDEGDIIDHGPMGIVEGVGSAVTHIKPGIGWSSPSTFPASIASCVARACSRSVKPPRSAKTEPARSSSVTRGFTARPYVPSWLALCAHGRSRRL